jgi:hypothetical protein
MKRVLFGAGILTGLLYSIYMLGTESDRSKRAMDDVIARRAAEREVQLKLDLEKFYGHPCHIGVKMQAYSLLHQGMSEVDARNIIGGEGIEQSSMLNTVTKRWQDGSKFIELTFQDGRIVGKSQSGL